MDKPKCYIAAPLFNEPQIELIQRLEFMLEKNGFPYFSPRKETKGLLPRGNDKKDPTKWKPLFDCNIRGLRECPWMLAVLNFYMPAGTGMYIMKEKETLCAEDGLPYGNSIELPDSGTVWEMGYVRGIGNKLVIGFHPTDGSHLNVMLTQGCHGVVSTLGRLSRFLGGGGTPLRDTHDQLMVMSSAWETAQLFNWDMCAQWGAEVE